MSNHFIRGCLYALIMVLLGTVPAHAALLNIIETASGPNNNQFVYTYNQSGTQLSAIPITPFPAKGYDEVHDLVQDKAGNYQVVYGGPYLATYNGTSWTYRTALNYSLFGVTYSGAIATYNNYVYVQSQNSSGSGNGIIRFDTSNNYTYTYTQLPAPGGFYYEPQDVTMGMDGGLYVNYYIGGAQGNEVVEFNPNTMDVIKSITLPTGNENGDHVVADAQGDIFVSGDNYLNKFSATGTFEKEIPLTGKGDLAISDDGEIMTTQNGIAYLFDTNLNMLNSVQLETAYWGEPFVAFAGYQAPVPEPGSMGMMVLGLGVLLRRRR